MAQDPIQANWPEVARRFEDRASKAKTVDEFERMKRCAEGAWWKALTLTPSEIKRRIAALAFNP